MIIGPLKPDYDEFEAAIDHIIGSISEGYGLDFEFYCIGKTFSLAEAAFCSQAKDYENEMVNLKASDPEVWWSIATTDPLHDFKLNPLFHILRQSYFINIHSEFEAVWRDVLELYNLHRNESSRLKIEENKINKQLFDKLLDHSLLLSCINKHNILITYNTIRNNITHQNWVVYLRVVKN